MSEMYACGSAIVPERDACPAHLGDLVRLEALCVISYFRPHYVLHGRETYRVIILDLSHHAPDALRVNQAIDDDVSDVHALGPKFPR